MRAHPTQIRLPVRPLMELAAHRHAPSQRTAADLLGVTGRSVSRWHAEGGVPIRSAVAVADQLGVHPVEIWGDDYIALPDDERDVVGWHVRRVRIALDTRNLSRTEGASCPSTPPHRPTCSQSSTA